VTQQRFPVLPENHEFGSWLPENPALRFRHDLPNPNEFIPISRIR
jgi:hypothetical protein